MGWDRSQNSGWKKGTRVCKRRCIQQESKRSATENYSLAYISTSHQVVPPVCKVHVMTLLDPCLVLVGSLTMACRFMLNSQKNIKGHNGAVQTCTCTCKTPEPIKIVIYMMVPHSLAQFTRSTTVLVTLWSIHNH